MRIQYILFALLSVLLLSCASDQANDNTTSKDEQRDVTNSHTSQNSLDWKGTYTGIMPCASCEGIETTLEINDNQSYTLTLIYLGEDEPNKVERSGSFSWNETGNIITLDDEDEPNQYFVGENYITKLDMEGNRITGELADKYVLRKK